MMSDKTMEKVTNLAEAPIEAVFTDPTYGKVFLFSFSCMLTFYVSRKLDILLSLYLLIFCYNYFQFERGEALENITQDVKRVLEEEGDEESLKVLAKAVDTVRKKVRSILILPFFHLVQFVAILF